MEYDLIAIIIASISAFISLCSFLNVLYFNVLKYKKSKIEKVNEGIMDRVLDAYKDLLRAYNNKLVKKIDITLYLNKMDQVCCMYYENQVDKKTFDSALQDYLIYSKEFIRINENDNSKLKFDEETFSKSFSSLFKYIKSHQDIGNEAEKSSSK